MNLLLRSVVLLIASTGVLMGEDLLPSWNEGPVKASIIKFVEDSVNENSPGYVPERKRIAVLDLDGTLVVEWPVNFQRALAVKKLKAAAQINPNLREVQPYKAAWLDDGDYYNEQENHSLVFLKAFEGVDQDEYLSYVEAFLAKERLPYWDKPIQELFYQPGIELVHYLKTRGYEIFICSTTEEGCIRSLLEEVLGLDRVNVIGNEVAREVYEDSKGGVHFRFGSEFRTPENRDEYKSVYFTYRAARRPVFGFGNSSGDISMLKMASGKKGEVGFSLVLDHDDSAREIKYTSQKLLDEAKKKGWTVASMKRDFAVVFNRT